MLTQMAITAAKPQAPYKLRDSGGLYLLVKPSGNKSWRFRYKLRGRENMLSLGIFPIVTLAQGRSRRDDAKRTLADGRDPAQKRREEKLAAAVSVSNTFGVIAEEYIDKLKEEGAAESTLDKTACNRATYLPERTKLMQDWADLLDQFRTQSLRICW